MESVMSFNVSTQFKMNFSIPIDTIKENIISNLRENFGDNFADSIKNSNFDISFDSNTGVTVVVDTDINSIKQSNKKTKVTNKTTVVAKVENQEENKEPVSTVETPTEQPTQNTETKEETRYEMLARGKYPKLEKCTLTNAEINDELDKCPKVGLDKLKYFVGKSAQAPCILSDEQYLKYLKYKRDTLPALLQDSMSYYEQDCKRVLRVAYNNEDASNDKFKVIVEGDVSTEPTDEEKQYMNHWRFWSKVKYYEKKITVMDPFMYPKAKYNDVSVNKNRLLRYIKHTTECFWFKNPTTGVMQPVDQAVLDKILTQPDTRIDPNTQLKELFNNF